VFDPLSLNLYTYCHNNPVFYSDPTGHIAHPFLVVAGLVGFAAGAIAGGISSAIQGKFSWEAIVQGAAIGSTVGLTGGAGLAYGVTGSALASTGAVASGLGFGAAIVGSARATGFEQARQLLQAQQMRAGVGAENGLIKEGLGKISGNTYQVTQFNIDSITRHLSGDLYAEENVAMINRLQNALNSGQSITGADASFYLHELKEIELMQGGMIQTVAHDAAIDFYQVSKYSTYHPDVIKSYSGWFNDAWFNFWGIAR